MVGLSLSVGWQLPRVRCFASHASVLCEARGFVREMGRLFDLSKVAIEELALAVSEACRNAIDHADTALIFVSWQVAHQQVDVQVKDDGIFRRRVPFPELADSTSGFGIPLMMAMVDEFALSQGTPESPGTLVRLRKDIEEDDRQASVPVIVRVPDMAPGPLA
ncbi:MAG: ATP-binding protein [Actinomycetota bacterium]